MEQVRVIYSISTNALLAVIRSSDGTTVFNPAIYAMHEAPADEVLTWAPGFFSITEEEFIEFCNQWGVDIMAIINGN